MVQRVGPRESSGQLRRSRAARPPYRRCRVTPAARADPFPALRTVDVVGRLGMARRSIDHVAPLEPILTTTRTTARTIQPGRQRRSLSSRSPDPTTTRRSTTSAGVPGGPTRTSRSPRCSTRDPTATSPGSSCWARRVSTRRRHPWRRRSRATSVPAPAAAGLAALHGGRTRGHTCPFDFHPETALAMEHAAPGPHRHRRARPDLHPEHRALGARRRARASSIELRRARSGGISSSATATTASPNVMLDRRRRNVTGYVDLGELGGVDRWSDAAVGAWSVTWNLGEGWEPAFLCRVRRGARRASHRVLPPALRPHVVDGSPAARSPGAPGR